MIDYWLTIDPKLSPLGQMWAGQYDLGAKRERSCCVLAPKHEKASDPKPGSLYQNPEYDKWKPLHHKIHDTRLSDPQR